MDPRRTALARRPITVFFIAMLLFGLVELIVQVRAHLHDGYSLLAVMRQQDWYVVDGETGLRLFRPHAVFTRGHQVIHSNNLGLRGADIAIARSPRGVRIAILGASTVMGATALDDEHTLPALLESRLRAMLKGVEIEVINAGINGYTLTDEQAMLERRLAPLNPDLVVFYPGFNDFADYCLPANRRRATAVRGLPLLALPEWWMSGESVLDHTTSLRRVPHAVSGDKDPERLDLAPFQAKVRSLIEAAHRRGEPLIVATVARSFRRDQPLQIQETLSANIREKLPCFSLEGVHRLYERHNEALRAEARAANLPVIELDRIIPGGRHFFAATTHFTEFGEAAAAEAVASFLSEHRLLDLNAMQ